MSVEVIAIVIAAATLLVTLGGGAFAGFTWVIHRIDRVQDQVNGRIDKVETELVGVRTELTEVKIAVARLEGPQRRLIVDPR